jgi:DNA-binding MarR family transcriptional regulator
MVNRDTDSERDAITAQQMRRLLAEKELACDRYQRGVADATGLPEQDVRVLVCVSRHGRLTPALLALRVGLTPAVLGPPLARLLEAGLLERRPHPHDGRTSRITLTEAGAALLEREFAELADRLDAVFASLSADDRRTVTAFLAGLVDASADAAAAVESRVAAADAGLPRGTVAR